MQDDVWNLQESILFLVECRVSCWKDVLNWFLKCSLKWSFCLCYLRQHLKWYLGAGLTLPMVSLGIPNLQSILESLLVCLKIVRHSLIILRWEQRFFDEHMILIRYFHLSKKLTTVEEVEFILILGLVECNLKQFVWDYQTTGMVFR